MLCLNLFVVLIFFGRVLPVSGCWLVAIKDMENINKLKADVLRMKAGNATGINRELLLAKSTLTALLPNRSGYHHDSLSELETGANHACSSGRTEQLQFPSAPYTLRALQDDRRNNRRDMRVVPLSVGGLLLLGSVLLSWWKNSSTNVKSGGTGQQMEGEGS